ncbi:cytidine deaminase-like protein [Infundibulicybe gibba]|nr:cytidine deaminase-like protein [Infundibulicybe gibba]
MDIWWPRHHPCMLTIPFKMKRAEKANTIGLFVSSEVPEGGEKTHWEGLFEGEVQPPREEEKQEWAKKLVSVVSSSDTFFLFADNVHRASKSGVKLAAPSGSVVDKECIKAGI